jgi:glycosyltransferase involved in cell wall biosynthesis
MKKLLDNQKIDLNQKRKRTIIKKKISLIQLIFLLIIVFLLLKKEKKPKSPPQTKELPIAETNFHNLLKFENLLPKLNNTNFNNLDDIYKSRELFIYDNNISIQYINFIKPINEIEEKNYQDKSYENEENFERFLKKRNDQLTYKEFIKICQNEKFIDLNVQNDNNNPLISIIVSSYNKGDLVFKTVRSIQNQSLKNIEIIIVDDCSTDNSYIKYKNLLETDPRIRIFYHQKNMGLWRTRLNGFLYSRGKFILFYEADDFYEDNYVLEDFYFLMNKYNLDSLKMIFRIINSYNYIDYSRIPFHVKGNSKIVYGTQNIENKNNEVFDGWGNIWNRIIRRNIFTKSLNFLNERVLNLYLNRHDDYFINKIINKASFSFLVVERVGYVYYFDGKGEGTVKTYNEKLRNKGIQQFISKLYFEHNLLPKNDSKIEIIEKLREYNNKTSRVRLDFFRSKFYLLNDLIKILINDPYVTNDDRKFLNQILNESHILENKVKSNYIIE